MKIEEVKQSLKDIVFQLESITEGKIKHKKVFYGSVNNEIANVYISRM